MSGFIVPFFIHHQGCPHRCSFCDQNLVVGNSSATSNDYGQGLEETIERWLAWNRHKKPVQLAFYGGSFTCLDEKIQQALFTAAAPYLQNGRLDSLRLSTRPDCLSADICQYLLAQGVKTVEVGVQSLDNQVLQKVARGHRAEDSVRAIQVLKKSGIGTGIQLLPGLPGETTGSFLAGVRTIIGLQPDFVRLYPVLVLQGTGLAKRYQRSRWRPLSLNRAVALLRKARAKFLENNIKVIRMGLHPSAALEKSLIAGPYHPAFGELVVGRHWFLRARRILSSNRDATTVTFTISSRDCSAFIGPGRQNLARLKRLFPACTVRLEHKKDLERNSLTYAIGS